MCWIYHYITCFFLKRSCMTHIFKQIHSMKQAWLLYDTYNNCEIFGVTKVYCCQTYPSHNFFHKRCFNEFTKLFEASKGQSLMTFSNHVSFITLYINTMAIYLTYTSQTDDWQQKTSGCNTETWIYMTWAEQIGIFYFLQVGIHNPYSCA